MEKRALGALAAALLTLGALLGAASSSATTNSGEGAGAAPAVLPHLAATGPNLVRLLAGAFDPLAEPLPQGAGLQLVDASSLPAATAQPWLVQAADSRFADATDAITAAGGKIVGFVPDGAYIVSATPAQRAAIDASEAVRWSGYFQPTWRVAHGPYPNPAALDGESILRVYGFRDDPRSGGLMGALAAIAGVRIVQEDEAVVDVEAGAAAVAAIASLPAVEWVELRPQEELHNANARWVNDTGVRDVFAATTHLTGAGQTAAVADTAINYRPDNNGRAHMAWRDCPGGVCKQADYTGNTTLNTVAHGTNHRKVAAFFDFSGTGPNPFDDSSHGSHVSGSVAGDADADGLPDGHDGMAPGARLVHQNTGTAAGTLTIPADRYTLFRLAYRPRKPASVATTSPAGGNRVDGSPDCVDPAGATTASTCYRPLEDARTHNNSWGSAIGGVVSAHTEGPNVDRFVWDHEDMVIVFSAGNTGPNAETIGAPSSAKNDISSGASANGRQPMGSIDSMAIFSSHGPTPDGRFGPDLATPGQIVVSAKGGTVNYYHHAQGTSMSAPVLTGLSTLVRQYFWDGYGPAAGKGFAGGAPDASRRHNSSAALVKAALINGAVRMRGWYTGLDGRFRAQDGQWPSAGQGYGQVNLDNSLYFAGDRAAAWYTDVWRGDTQAFPVANTVQTRTYQLNVAAGEPLDVTLAWTDAPVAGATGVSTLANNLNVTLTDPAGVTYVGNNMNSREAGAVDVAETLPGPAPPDVREVTERVRVANPAAGTWTITVQGGPVVIGTQGFALAASGRISAPGESFTPGPPLQADEAGSPTISGVSVQPVSADTAVVRFTTSEPTTATAVAGGATYVDSYNVGNDLPSIGAGPGFFGLNEGQSETSDAYANRPVVGTKHEVVLTGLQPNQTYAVQLAARDLAGNQATASVDHKAPRYVYAADAPDIAQLAPSTGGAAPGWKTGTQMYASNNAFLGAFMFRVPAAIDPNDVIGATVEATSAHNWVVPYTQDPLLTLDLLDQSVEAPWGTQTYEVIRGAARAARLTAETTHKRGGGVRYAFTFRCSDLPALRASMASGPLGDRLLAFRWDSNAAGLFALDFGFNRRSNGPDKRPRLVLYPFDGTDPFGVEPDPLTPAPPISEIGVHAGSAAGTVAVTWDTDVESDSVVLFRQKGAEQWTQVASPARTTLHQLQIFGLNSAVDYEFVVRSAATNGNTTTDTNGGAGYDFYPIAPSPLTGPKPPVSAGATDLTAPPTHPGARPEDIAAGTGTCGRPPNEAPIALDDEASVEKGGSVVIDVLANDDSVDGDELSIDSFSSPGHGIVTENPDETLTYEHNGDFATADSFTYTVSDGNGGSDTATVLINIHQPIPPGTKFVADFVGDARDDIAVWRPSNGTWYVHGDFGGVQWGRAGDIPVPGDYIGDSKAEFAVFRPENGTWYVYGDWGGVQWGSPGDIPVPANYHGDSKDEFAVWRPTAKWTWYIHGLDPHGRQWGHANNVPVPGDYDADPYDDIATYNTQSGHWWIEGDYIGVDWGQAGDVPVQGDYNADGKDEFAVWRPSDGSWHVVIGEEGPTQWGTAGDIPVPGNFDGDPATDKTVWRPSNGTWYVEGNWTGVQWGISTDVP